LAGDFARHDKNQWSFGAFESAGEKIIHHQRGNERSDTKILLRVVIEHMQPKLIAAASKPCKKLIHRKFLFIGPLANGVEQSPPLPSQICARFDASRRGEELTQIGIVKIRIRIFVELAFARVISLELNIQTIVIGDAIRWRMQGRLVGE